MTAPVRVVLHGGLGNQLFQYFKARLMTVDTVQPRIMLYGDLLGRYSTARGFELETLLRAEALPFVGISPIDSLSRLRIPKLMHRLTRHECVPSIPAFGTIVDGYFQVDRSFEAHSGHAMRGVLFAWRDALNRSGLLQRPTRKRLLHIRLGDFFESPARARAYAAARIAEVEGDCDLVTDQENLVDEVVKSQGQQGLVRLIPSAGWDAWRLLSWMTGYRCLATNGSTLAYWAAALGGAKLHSTNLEHGRIFARLSDANR